MKIKHLFHICIAFTATITLALAQGSQTPKWMGTITKDGYVVVVKNPKEPLYDKPVLSLQQDYSIGGAQARGEYALSLPTSIAVDEKGYLYILDFKENRVKVFDEAGSFVRAIGRPVGRRRKRGRQALFRDQDDQMTGTSRSGKEGI